LPVLIAVVGGGVLGAAWGGGFGALVGALLGWLFYRSSQQQRSIAELRESLKDLQALRRAVADPARAVAVERPQPSGESAAPAAPVQAASAARSAGPAAPAATAATATASAVIAGPTRQRPRS
jgi:predicted lipid-binding transport protein (Tim44 family)